MTDAIEVVYHAPHVLDVVGHASFSIKGEGVRREGILPPIARALMRNGADPATPVRLTRARDGVEVGPEGLTLEACGRMTGQDEWDLVEGRSSGAAANTTKH